MEGAISVVVAVDLAGSFPLTNGTLLGTSEDERAQALSKKLGSVKKSGTATMVQMSGFV